MKSKSMSVNTLTSAIFFLFSFSLAIFSPTRQRKFFKKGTSINSIYSFSRIIKGSSRVPSRK